MTIAQLIDELISLRNTYGDINVTMPDGSDVTHVGVEMPNFMDSSAVNIYASYTYTAGTAVINQGSRDNRLPIIGHGGY